VALDGKPCSACTEDIELEKALKELENQIEQMHTKRRALRTVMNENHDPFIAKFPPEISSQISIHYPPQLGVSTKMIKARHYILELYARNGDSWPGGHLSFGPRSSLNSNLVHLSYWPNIWNVQPISP
jgi:hypothetical protein